MAEVFSVHDLQALKHLDSNRLRIAFGQFLIFHEGAEISTLEELHCQVDIEPVFKPPRELDKMLRVLVEEQSKKSDTSRSMGRVAQDDMCDLYRAKSHQDTYFVWFCQQLPDLFDGPSGAGLTTPFLIDRTESTFPELLEPLPRLHPARAGENCVFNLSMKKLGRELVLGEPRKYSH